MGCGRWLSVESELEEGDGGRRSSLHGTQHSCSLRAGPWSDQAACFISATSSCCSAVEKQSALAAGMRALGANQRLFPTSPVSQGPHHCLHRGKGPGLHARLVTERCLGSSQLTLRSHGCPAESGVEKVPPVSASPGASKAGTSCRVWGAQAALLFQAASVVVALVPVTSCYLKSHFIDVFLHFEQDLS